VLFADYTHALDTAHLSTSFDLSNHMVIIGLFLGGLIPYLFAAMAMEAVGRAAGAVVVEVRRQFRDIKGIMEGTGEARVRRRRRHADEGRDPRNDRAVAAAGARAGGRRPRARTAGARRPADGHHRDRTLRRDLDDDRRRRVGQREEIHRDGHHGGKGSDAHKAAVTGDTVGDPYKDTAGPAVNPLIKIINIVALMIVPLLAVHGTDAAKPAAAMKAPVSAPAAVTVPGNDACGNAGARASQVARRLPRNLCSALAPRAAGSAARTRGAKVSCVATDVHSPMRRMFPTRLAGVVRAR
jgi:K(+)-stimulated pyrophosphate-energized sodium pump